MQFLYHSIYKGRTLIYKTTKGLSLWSVFTSMQLRMLFLAAIVFIGLSTPLTGQTTVTYTTPGTNSFTVPANVTEITVEAWGGGGRGGQRSGGGNTAGSGGGGGGAYTRSVISVVPGETFSLFVGGGSTTTNPGEDSWFINFSTLLAKGGGSAANNTVNGAIGGSAANSIGDIKFSGGSGANGSGTNFGGGGGSSAGFEADGVSATNNNGATAPDGGGDGGNGKSGAEGAGSPGSTPGGGGGGALKTHSANNFYAGGAGANGQVIVSYTIPDPDTVFDFYKTYETDHTKVSGTTDLTDFPVLFSITDPDYKHTSQGGKIENFDGYDITFTLEDNTLIDHDLEFYDPVEGTIIAWVRFPILSASENTTFKLFYGSEEINHNTSSSTTWNDDYALVMHMTGTPKDTSTAGNTVNTDSGTSSEPNGRIGGARAFTNQSFIQIDDSPSLDINEDISISLWVNPQNISTFPDLVTKGDFSESYSTEIDTSGELLFRLNGNAFISTQSINNNDWFYLAFTKNGTNWAIYINGEEQGSGTNAPATIDSAGDLLLSSSAYPFVGLMDEVRISSAARSADWIATKYNNQNNPESFIIDVSVELPKLENIEATPVYYTAGDGPVPVTQNITVTYDGGANLTGATIEIANNYNGGEDILDFPGHAGISGNWDAGTGVLSLSGTAGVTDYQQALRLVTYENTSASPVFDSRTISFNVNDGILFSDTLSRNIDFVADGAFAGLLLWLKGEEGTFQDLGATAPATVNGQPVREWHDQSSNNRIFSTTGTPPTLATNVAELNGRSAIRFAGTGDELADLGGGTYINGLTEFTIFVVIKSDITGTDRGFWHTQDPDGEDKIFTIRYDEEGLYADPKPVNNIKLGVLDNAQENQIESFSDVQVTDGQIVMLQWKSGEAYDLFVDGIINNPALLFDPPEGSLFGATKALLGKGSKDGNNMSWDGLIGEVILYNRLLDTEERLEKEDYLSEKYGISVRNLTPAKGGEAISADDIGASFTTLSGPIIKEGFRGQLSAGGTFVLKVPDGFEWDTGGSDPSALVGPVYGGSTDLAVSFTSRTSEEITFTITQSSSASPGSRIGQIDFSGLRVRPTTGQLPNEGNILNIGTTGFAGQTNYGTLTMVAGNGHKLYFSTQPSNATVNLPITPSVRVEVWDQFDNKIIQEGISISIVLSEGSGNLSGTQVVPTNESGDAVFAGLSIDEPGSKRLTATASGIIDAESNLFEVMFEGVFTNFVIEELPEGDITDKIAGEEFQVIIKAVDGNGTIDEDFESTVVITSSGTLGTGFGTTQPFVNGVLASHTLSVISTGQVYVTATHSEGQETGNSNFFNVSPGPASVVESTISANPAVIRNNGTSTSQITVQLKDTYNNPLNTGGNNVVLSATAGSLSSVTDNGNGSYSAVLTSSINQTTAVISGTIDGQEMTQTASVIFAEFDFIWQGTLGDAQTADQWEYGPNWNTGTVPGSANAALIPSNPAVGNKFPVVSTTNTVVGKVVIETGASLTISGGVNFIVEDFISGSGALINGSTQDTLSIGGTIDLQSITLGTVIFNGTQNQSIISPHSYTNMGIDNPETVFANDNLFVSGLLTLTDGILRIPNNKVLIANNKSIGNGQLQFVRSITGPKGWRMLGSPVSSTYGDLLDGTLTQGYAGSTLGTTFNDEPLQPNVFWYEESFPGTDNQRWRAPDNASESLTAGRGLYVYFFGDVDGDDRYNDPLPHNLVVTGQEFEGDGTMFDFDISFTLEADTGWNFVSNPFGASLNWDSPGWTKNNIDNTFYIWNPSANGGHGEFLTWNGNSGTLGNGIIRPFQGFWVKAQGPGAELRVNKSAKTSGGSFVLKNGQYQPSPQSGKDTRSYPEMMADTYDNYKPIIILQVRAGPFEANKTITFREDASMQKDTHDGYRLLPLTDTFVALFSVLDDGSELVVNNLPTSFSNRMRTPLHVAGYVDEMLISGPYTISWPGLRSIPPDWVLLLVDNETGERINMQKKNNYSFNLVNSDQDPTYNGNDPGGNDYRLTNKNYDKARFTLVVSTEDIEENIPWDLFMTQNFPNPFRESTTIRFGLSEEADVKLQAFDIMGRKVDTLVDGHLAPGYYEHTWSAGHLPSGIYMMVLRSGKDVETFKMILIR